MARARKSQQRLVFVVGVGGAVALLGWWALMQRRQQSQPERERVGYAAVAPQAAEGLRRALGAPRP